MPKPQVASRSLSVELDSQLRARLEALAASQDRAPSWIVQKAVQAYVDKTEAEEALWREAVASHNDYLSTGLNLDHQTADAWLAKLAAGEDADLPQWQGACLGCI